MKVRILETTVVSGTTVSPNQVINAEDTEAEFLIVLGKAEVFKDKKKASKGK
jgi:hypothetical protein